MSGPDPVAVRDTFTSVAPRYDLANHLLSGGIDFLWRRKLVKQARQGAHDQILDLATGSGDVALALRYGLSGKIKITGVDKELVSKIAADLKNLKPVEPYKAKGIKEKGQFVLRKEGKKK